MGHKESDTTEATEHAGTHMHSSLPFARVVQAEAPMCLRTFALSLPAGWCCLCPSMLVEHTLAYSSSPLTHPLHREVFLIIPTHTAFPLLITLLLSPGSISFQHLSLTFEFLCVHVLIIHLHPLECSLWEDREQVCSVWFHPPI